jgi:hypothetical protein
MARNAYYQSRHWRDLKRTTHERDHHRCVVPGCGSSDKLVCDHIETRPNVDYPTPADVLANTRTLCDLHDRQIKENRHGVRGRHGKTSLVGSDADGWPAS